MQNRYLSDCSAQKIQKLGPYLEANASSGSALIKILKDHWLAILNGWDPGSILPSYVTWGPSSGRRGLYLTSQTPGATKKYICEVVHSKHSGDGSWWQGCKSEGDTRLVPSRYLYELLGLIQVSKPNQVQSTFPRPLGQ